MPLLNRPYWLERATTDYPSLTRDLDVEVAVIGAGITGLSAAHLLKQAGKTVAVLEMNRIGYGATGYTTAKLAVSHSLVYSALRGVLRRRDRASICPFQPGGDRAGRPDRERAVDRM